MSLDRHSYKWLIVGLVASIALVAPVLIFWNHHVKARASRSGVRQVESHDFGSRMVDYIKKGRYDDAVRVGLQSLQNGPSDESVYQQIASVYLIRAQKDDPSQRERWVAMAVSNIEKALSLNLGAALTTSGQRSFSRIEFPCWRTTNSPWKGRPIPSPLSGRRTKEPLPR